MFRAFRILLLILNICWPLQKVNSKGKDNLNNLIFHILTFPIYTCVNTLDVNDKHLRYFVYIMFSCVKYIFLAYQSTWFHPNMVCGDTCCIHIYGRKLAIFVSTL